MCEHLVSMSATMFWDAQHAKLFLPAFLKISNEVMFDINVLSSHELADSLPNVWQTDCL